MQCHESLEVHHLNHLSLAEFVQTNGLLKRLARNETLPPLEYLASSFVPECRPNETYRSWLIRQLSATLRGAITFENGVVQQGNFRDYPVLRMNDAPLFDVQIVASTRPPTGAGEIGTPPVAPAIANALFALSGRRVRRLPLLEHLG